MLEFENERYVGLIPSGGGGGSAVITSLSVTPSTSAQTFNASNVDGYKPVTVSAVTSAIDNNITAGNIKDGVTILGVTGSYTGGSANIDSLSITPTTSSQTITASGVVDGYSPITVSAVTSSIDANITAQNIVSGVSILGVSGSATVLNGDTLSVTPTTSAQTLTPTSPKNGFTEVSVSAVTSAIDSNITAGNIKKDVVILGVTGSYEGSGGGGGSGTTDVPLTRFKDDNNNEIGTHYMNFEDANGNIYKVILLDAQYRTASTQWCDEVVVVTNMPIYDFSYNLWWYDNAKETATQNTQLILDYCSAEDYTSTACSYCRSQSFTINGTTYYGQLPNMREVFDMWRHRVQIEQMDTSASSHSSTNFSSARNIWSSTQDSKFSSWGLSIDGYVSYINKTSNLFACPVLEIPA